MEIQKSMSISIYSILMGVGFIILNFISYQSFQPIVITDENSIWIQKVSYIFYIILFGAIALIAYGIHIILHLSNSQTHSSSLYLSSLTEPHRVSLSQIVLSVINDKKYFRFFWPVSIAYGIFYASISGILIYRNDDFSSLYGITVPYITMMTYGPMGYVPTLAVYLTQHIGILIIPLNLLITITVAALVGFNTVLTIYAIQSRPKKYVSRVNVKAGFFLSAIGATTSLFASCPTCASFYIFSIVTGSLAPTVAAFTSTFYALFLSLSIPLLVFTPFLTALNIRRTAYSRCSI